MQEAGGKKLRPTATKRRRAENLGATDGGAGQKAGTKQNWLNFDVCHEMTMLRRKPHFREILSIRWKSFYQL